jgi:hypothetical protein
MILFRRANKTDYNTSGNQVWKLAIYTTREQGYGQGAGNANDGTSDEWWLTRSMSRLSADQGLVGQPSQPTAHVSADDWKAGDASCWPMSLTEIVFMALGKRVIKAKVIAGDARNHIALNPRIALDCNEDVSEEARCTMLRLHICPLRLFL